MHANPPTTNSQSKLHHHVLSPQRSIRPSLTSKMTVPGSKTSMAILAGIRRLETGDRKKTLIKAVIIRYGSCPSLK